MPVLDLSGCPISDSNPREMLAGRAPEPLGHAISQKKDKPEHICYKRKERTAKERQKERQKNCYMQEIAKKGPADAQQTANETFRCKKWLVLAV